MLHCMPKPPLILAGVYSTMLVCLLLPFMTKKSCFDGLSVILAMAIPARHDQSSSTKQSAFIHEVRWAASLCAYAMMKRPLIWNVDAAPFGRVPKVFGDTDYTQYCTGLVFIGSRPHWPVVLVKKMLNTWDQSPMWGVSLLNSDPVCLNCLYHTKREFYP